RPSDGGIRFVLAPAWSGRRSSDRPQSSAPLASRRTRRCRFPRPRRASVQCAVVHVVVVGCGRVGSGLAQSVEAAGHTVAIIDRRESAFRRLPPDFAGKRIVGVGFDRDRLEEAGISDAVAVASVTNGDNSNIMIARVAKETYG